jgi:catechol 2,3-dioxygenase-like lactoylglutathione lyase family enzyme
MADVRNAVSETSKTADRVLRSIGGMKLRPALLELVVSDMAATLAFYRLLGMDIPAEADGQAHVDADLGGGLRIAFDTQDTIRSFDPGWTPAEGGHRVALAFACDSPA